MLFVRITSRSQSHRVAAQVHLFLSDSSSRLPMYSKTTYARLITCRPRTTALIALQPGCHLRFTLVRSHANDLSQGHSFFARQLTSNQHSASSTFNWLSLPPILILSQLLTGWPDRLARGRDEKGRKRCKSGRA